jgi:5-methylcytosine-specific restriction endonuclease McrA
MPGIASSFARGKSSRKVLERLALRDGGLCWICSLPMVFDRVDGGLCVSASVDHIIPKRLGGTNDQHNLRLAHRRCNQNRDSGAITNLGRLERAIIEYQRRSVVGVTGIEPA